MIIAVSGWTVFFVIGGILYGLYRANKDADYKYKIEETGGATDLDLENM